MKRLEIGRLGTYDLIPGFYAYVGSAFGPGGLRARLRHHLESVAEPHWHIDYLLAHAEPVEVWYALSDRKLEQDLAEVLERVLGLPHADPPLRFFGLPPQPHQPSLLFQAPAFIQHRFQQEVNRAFGEPPVLVRSAGSFLGSRVFNRAAGLRPVG